MGLRMEIRQLKKSIKEVPKRRWKSERRKGTNEASQWLR
jgi:hypothetical protein